MISDTSLLFETGSQDGMTSRKTTGWLVSGIGKDTVLAPGTVDEDGSALSLPPLSENSWIRALDSTTEQ